MYEMMLRLYYETKSRIFDTTPIILNHYSGEIVVMEGG